jgi:hypothetical protein
LTGFLFPPSGGPHCAPPAVLQKAPAVSPGEG